MSELTTEKVLDFIQKLSESDELRVAWTETGKASLWAAAGAMVGAATMGPLGILIGAVAGGGYGAVSCEKYKSLLEVLNDMSSDDKQRLLKNIMDILMSHGVTTTVGLATLLAAGPSSAKTAVLESLGKNLQSMLSVSLQS